MLTTALTAGAALQEERVSEPSASVRLVAMIWDDGTSLPAVFGLQQGDDFPQGVELYLWRGGKDTEPISIPYGARSLPIELKGSQKVILFKRPFNPEVHGDLPPVAAMVDLAGDASDVFLLMVPEDLHNNDFQCVLLDESLTVFPPSSVRLVNLSNAALAVRFGADDHQVAPKSDKIVSLNDSKQRSVRMLVAFNIGGSAEYISRRLSVFDGVRITCFFVSDASRPGDLVTKIVTEDARYTEQRERPLQSFADLNKP